MRRARDFPKARSIFISTSKEALFTALVETFAMPNIERFENLATSAGGGLAAIRAILKFAPAIIRETPVPKLVKVLIGDAPAFPEMATAYREQVADRVLGMVAGLLKQANETGEINIEDPALTARIVVAPIILSALWRIVFEHDPMARVDLGALFAVHEEMLMRALNARGAEHE